MKRHFKRFGWGFGIMALLNIIYSSYARGVVNVTATLSCAVAGGLIVMIGFMYAERNKNDKPDKTKAPKETVSESESTNTGEEQN